MAHLDTYAIERYLLGDEALGRKERDEIERHLAQCPACHSVYYWLKDFYEDQELKSGASEDIRIDDRLDQLWADSPRHPKLITLRPLEHPAEDEPKRREEAMVVLAAKSVPDDAQRYVQVAALASSNEKILARILFDRRDQQYNLYLLSGNDDQQVGQAILSLPQWNLDLVTNERGKLTFEAPPSLQENNWADATVYLRLPVFELSGAPVELAGTHAIDDVRVGEVDISCGDHELNVTLTPTSKSAVSWSRLLVKTRDAARRLIKLENHTAQVSIPDCRQAIGLCFYP